MKKIYFMCVLSTAILFVGCGSIRIRNNEPQNINNTIEETDLENSKTVNISSLTFNTDIFGDNGNSQGSLKGGTNMTLVGGYLTFDQIFESKSKILLIDKNEKAHFLCFDESCNHYESTCISNEEMNSLQYYKGSIYYVKQRQIMKVENNKPVIVYGNDSYVENFGIRENKLYFSDDNGICTVDMNTMEKTCICDIRPCYFSLNINNDIIYFSSETFQLYSMNYDGSNLKLLSDDYAFEPQYMNGFLYYRNMNNNSLVKMNIQSGEKTVIVNNVYQLCVCKDAIYYLEYKEGSDKYNLFRYSYNTEKASLLCQTTLEYFCIYDELDYILVGEPVEQKDKLGNTYIEGRPYLINKDGSNKRELVLPQFLEGEQHDKTD